MDRKVNGRRTTTTSVSPKRKLLATIMITRGNSRSPPTLSSSTRSQGPGGKGNDVNAADDASKQQQQQQQHTPSRKNKRFARWLVPLAPFPEDVVASGEQGRQQATTTATETFPHPPSFWESMPIDPTSEQQIKLVATSNGSRLVFRVGDDDEDNKLGAFIERQTTESLSSSSFAGENSNNSHGRTLERFHIWQDQERTVLIGTVKEVAPPENPAVPMGLRFSRQYRMYRSEPMYKGQPRTRHRRIRVGDEEQQQEQQQLPTPQEDPAVGNSLGGWRSPTPSLSSCTTSDDDDDDEETVLTARTSFYPRRRRRSQQQHPLSHKLDILYHCSDISSRPSGLFGKQQKHSMRFHLSQPKAWTNYSITHKQHPWPQTPGRSQQQDVATPMAVIRSEGNKNQSAAALFQKQGGEATPNSSPRGAPQPEAAEQNISVKPGFDPLLMSIFFAVTGSSGSSNGGSSGSTR